MKRSFISRVDAGKGGDLPGTGSPIEPFRVTPLADRQRAIQEHFDEVHTACGGNGSRLLAVILKRTNQRHDYDEASARHESRDFSDPANILSAVLGRKSQIRA